MDKYVHRAYELWNALWWHESGEVEVLCEACGGNLLLQPFTQDAVADPQKAHIRIALHNLDGSADYVFMSLEMKQSRDFADDDVLRLEAELVPNLVAMLASMQER